MRKFGLVITREISHTLKIDMRAMQTYAPSFSLLLYALLFHGFVT